MFAPKISIITPVYNAVPYLKRCLDSVLSQTIKDWELICVDDGSTDDSAAILDAYAAKDARIKVIHQANQGVANARQRGLEAARGKYIGWVDSDDWIEPAHSDKLFRAAEMTGADMVWMGHVVEEDSKQTVEKMTCPENAEEMLSSVLACQMMGSLWDKLFLREAVIKSGACFDSRCAIMEDTYFLARFLSAKPKIKYVDAATYHYVRTKGSLTNRESSAEWWRKAIVADDAIQGAMRGCVPDDVLHLRSAKLKCWMYWNSEVPDEMFYRYHSEIRWLPKGVCGNLQRVLFFISTFQMRKVVRWLTRRN